MARVCGCGARQVLRNCFGVIALLLAASVQAEVSSPEAVSYALGRGLRLPARNLVLSGYASLHLDSLEGSDTRFDFRDLSLFATWSPTARWQIFAEIEGENVVTVDDRGITAHDTEIEIERLYADFAAAPAMTLRTGRYLTPFGRWNLVHAEPLVWTATRPLVTMVAIPDHAVGVQAYGSLALDDGSLEYSVYIDDSDDVDPRHGEASFEEINLPGLSNNFDHAIGAQLRYHFFGERAELGASFASFAVDEMAGEQQLFGVDGAVRWQRFEFSTELTYRLNASPAPRDDWGGFVQGVVPLVGHLYGVGRVEYYSSGVLADDAGRASLGLAYRPQPAITYKFEYHDGSNGRILPDGWEMSCGILF